MNSPMDAIKKGKEVVRIEAEAIRALENKIDEAFAGVVDLISKINGRVVITGMGKSGLIARKIVATMNSTGTPAIYMHPSDAVHGDLGMVRPEDVVVCISKSGDTEEILQLVPLFKRIGVPIISIIGNKVSKLGRESDFVLDASVEQEACPYDLAPTASTTAALVIGDALAIALLDRKNFTEEEFAMFHPGGNLGKRLFLRLEELMVKGKDIPKVAVSTSLRETILVMTSGRLGAACVVNSDNQLVGIITDGDLRRLLQKDLDFSHLIIDDVMTRNPKFVKQNTLAVAALELMENFNISQLVVVDDFHKPAGMIHLHDLVKAGLSSKSES
ncbi:MAG TPA: KpsF/GutQ family sugar-phosphate isomerase [Candidatus Acidoferrales bacterium]|nr:KpsF/GutQ family sugar-phosphate isomerase [Candidatus Acidoferrales bacterium]